MLLSYNRKVSSLIPGSFCLLITWCPCVWTSGFSHSPKNVQPQVNRLALSMVSLVVINPLLYSSLLRLFSIVNRIYQEAQWSAWRLVLLHLPTLLPGGGNITAPHTHTHHNTMCQAPSLWPRPPLLLSLTSFLSLYPSIIPHSKCFYLLSAASQSFVNCSWRRWN